jgi:hypothetical protein
LTAWRAPSMQGAGLWSPPTASSAIFIRDGVLTDDVVVNGSAQTSPASLSNVCERRLRENRNRQDGQNGLPARPQQAQQAEVEVAVERRSDSCNLSLGVSLNLSESWGPFSPSCLARIIHERFCCNCGFAAATSLDAVGTASKQAGLCGSAGLTFKTVAPSRRRLGSEACLAQPYRGPAPL